MAPLTEGAGDEVWALIEEGVDGEVVRLFMYRLRARCCRKMQQLIMANF